VRSRSLISAFEEEEYPGGSYQVRVSLYLKSTHHGIIGQGEGRSYFNGLAEESTLIDFMRCELAGITKRSRMNNKNLVRCVKRSLEHCRIPVGARQREGIRQLNSTKTLSTNRMICYREYINISMIQPDRNQECLR
jgi:hypothetical protein